MVTIYLVDTELDKITIHQTEDTSAIPVARGMLYVNDAGHNRSQCKEIWLADEAAYWMQYEDSPMYCLVKNSTLS
jgi:hypothetical protein